MDALNTCGNFVTRIGGSIPMLNIGRERLVEALAELVQIPSINPDLVPGAGGERDIAEAIAARLRRTPGIQVEIQDAGDGRPNVIASVGKGEGRTLLLNGHIDTVGVEGMANPYDARVEGDRLYGRGSSDMKNSMAAAIILMEAIADAGDLPGKVVVTFVVDEEFASIGTQAICREIDRWHPDAAVVLEHTDLNVSIAHKGFVWATIQTQGRAAHGSRYQEGIDAITQMGKVLVGLDRLGNELLKRPPHEYVGPPSIHASLISGGQELSSYPEFCTLEVERRTIPGETVEQVRDELRSILEPLSDEIEQFSASLTMGLVREPFEVTPESEIVRRLSTAVRHETGRLPDLEGAGGWMDSALLAAAGVPTAIFGPGGDGAHALEEWADLDSLEAFTRILTRVIYDFCV